jgi:hypothetical protein
MPLQSSSGRVSTRRSTRALSSSSSVIVQPSPRQLLVHSSFENVLERAARILQKEWRQKMQHLKTHMLVQRYDALMSVKHVKAIRYDVYMLGGLFTRH